MKVPSPLGAARTAGRAVAVSLALTGIGQSVARSQELSNPLSPPFARPTVFPPAPDGPAVPAQPGAFPPAPAPVYLEDDPATPWFDESELSVPPPVYNPTKPPTVVMGPIDCIYESIFGPADPKMWKPLTLSTFFTQGWDEPFVNAPPGINGAPKQNWIGAPAGIFGRFATLDFFYTNQMNNVFGAFLSPNAPFMPVHPFTNGNQYTGFATILLPLNSRMELFIGTVFIASNKSSPAGGYTGNWGDTGIQARFHLIEQRDFSLVGSIGERIPTGKGVNGNDINYVTPALSFWWNFAPKWVLRGGTQINISTGKKDIASIYLNQLSVGRYLTTKDAAFFKQAEVHVTATIESDITGQANSVNDVYIFPGGRFSLDRDDHWAVLGGAQVPVSGPKAYDWQPQIALTVKW